MRSLRSSLPPRYESCGQVTRLLQALEQELYLLKQAAQALGARGLIAQADVYGLARWEEDLGLPHRPDLSLEGRRAILHAALDRTYHGTAEALTTYAQNLTGTDNVQVQQDYAAFALTMTAQESSLVDFYSLQHWVSKRLPVHVTGRFVRATTAESESTVENS